MHQNASAPLNIAMTESKGQPLCRSTLVSTLPIVDLSIFLLVLLRTHSGSTLWHSPGEETFFCVAPPLYGVTWEGKLDDTKGTEMARQRSQPIPAERMGGRNSPGFCTASLPRTSPESWTNGLSE